MQNWVLLKTLNLLPHVLPFQLHKCGLNWSSITPDIVKNLIRGETVTVQVFVNKQF